MKSRIVNTLATLALLPILLSGCGSSGNSLFNNGQPLSVAAPPAAQAQTTTFAQTERLARPAINEGLLITNDFLNAFNAIGPGSDGAALAGPVGAEAAATLTAVGSNSSDIALILAALTPDVMRLDTTIPNAQAGFSIAAVLAGNPTIDARLNPTSIPTGGRLLQDDVIDLILVVVTHNLATTDNVSYTGGGNVGQGHSAMSTTFPYLAPPQ